MSTLKFQCISWLSEDTDEYSDDNENKFYISMFGRTEDGQSVALRTHFQPFFFIEIPQNWSKTQILQIESALRDRLEHWGKCDSDFLSISTLKRKKFYGFTNNEEFKFVRLRFSTKETMSKAVKVFQTLKVFGKLFDLFEANVDPMLRFFHLQNIRPAGWCNTDHAVECDKICNTDIEFEVEDWKNIIGTNDEQIAPLIQASFDIETYSHDGGFPDPNQDCEVIQIATTLQRFGEQEPYKRHIITLKQCNPIEGVEIQSFDNESEVLLAWKDLLKQEQVDIIIGYNIWGFDLWYMYTRAKNLGVYAFMELGKFYDRTVEMRKASFSSGAYGDSDFYMVDMPGILQIDLLVIMKREHKLQSYTLNSVSAHFLKDNKVDMPYKTMFRKYETGSPDDIKEIAEYCVKDTDLPLRLMNKLAILPNMVEMAKATWVPMSFLIERGQGIKVFSQILYTTLQENMLVYTTKRSSAKEEAPYEGATVLKAKKGAYMDAPITGLDFASLYPTIMRAHNLCHSTLVMDDDKYGNIPGVSYDEIDGYKFAQSPEGILCKMLRELAQNRKTAKKAMAKAGDAGDHFMKAVYNGKQLAFKVSMNSIYGFCGALVGFLPCKPVAQCTTSKGRDMIEHTKNLVEKWYPGSEVVYGDSVTGDTPVVLRSKNNVYTTRIDNLVENYTTRQDGKEYANVDFSVWTENGFTKVNQVIRHKCNKKLYRILTHTGVVDATEDHSLLLANKQEISPCDVEIGTQLLHGNIVDAFNNDDSLTINEAKVMGFFFGDGSCGKYGAKYTWALNNSNIDYLLEMQMLCEFPTSIIDTIDSSGVYKLNAIEDIKSVCIKYRSLFYNNEKQKVIPQMILNSNTEIIQSFWDGYYMADGDKDENGYTRCDIKGKSGALGLYIITRKLGFNVSINTRDDKPDIYRLTMTKSTQRKHPHKIKKIIDLGYTDDYVYDLSTVYGHFHVGPGDLVVHNTDSVMVKFKTTAVGKDAIQESFVLGEEAADRISQTFRDPIELEMEKVYYPYLLFSKKRYAGLMYTNPNSPDYIDAKGIQLVRRDNCPFVKEISKKVLNTIMYEQDINKAITMTQTAAQQLLDGNVDVDSLIVSKSMKRVSYTDFEPRGKKFMKGTTKYLVHEYANANQPHLTVALKREEREPGTGPKSGDRVPYVFIQTRNPKDLQYKKAEDPEYVKLNNIKLDCEYYLLHGLQSPLESLFELFIKEPAKTLFGNSLNLFHKERNEQIDIYDLLGVNNI
jgi:DNA polymerase elongation subunit (family B)